MDPIDDGTWGAGLVPCRTRNLMHVFALTDRSWTPATTERGARDLSRAGPGTSCTLSKLPPSPSSSPWGEALAQAELGFDLSVPRRGVGGRAILGAP